MVAGGGGLTLNGDDCERRCTGSEARRCGTDHGRRWVVAGRLQTLPHRSGGGEIRFGRRELGHLHGDRITDLPFPLRLRDELIAVAARVRTTCCRTAAGVTVPLDGLEAADGAIELFGLSYARSVQAARPARLPRS